MKKLLLSLAVMSTMLAGASAQDYYGSIYWSVATPTGQFRSFVNETSVAGFGIDVQWWASDHISGGLVLGYNLWSCLLYTSPSPRDRTRSRMPSSA